MTSKQQSLAEIATKAYLVELESRQADQASGRPNRLFSNKVEVRHTDGSQFHLNFASFKESGPYLFVFTEHNGVLGFFREDLDNYQYLNSRSD